MSSFLVTGGTGFIGSQIVRELIAKGHHVTVYDAMPAPERLGEAKTEVHIVKGDILDLEELLLTLKKESVDYILHLAYFRDIAEQEQRPSKAVKVNINGFTNVLEAVRISGAARLVWASSVAVYGPCGKYPGSNNLNEFAPNLPTSIYGACKSFNEYLGKHYAEVLGVSNVGLRPDIVYGEGRWFRGFSTFAYDLFVNPALGKPVRIFKGDTKGNWLYVKELARAFLAASFAPNPKRHVYNINGVTASIREVAAVVKRLISEAQIEIEEGTDEPWPTDLDGRAAMQDLGYQPEISLEEGVRHYITAIRAAASGGQEV